MKNLMCFIGAAVIAVCCGNKSMETEIHLIPYGFKGRVSIYFNQTSGEPVVYEDGARVYVIPENGVLCTQFAEQTGSSEGISFYFIDSLGNRTVIPEVYANSKSHPSGIIMYGYRLGTFQQTMNDEDHYLLEYIIDEYNNIDKYKPFQVESYQNCE